QKSSRNRTYHVLKEAVAANAEGPRFTRAVPTGFEDRPGAVLDFRRRRTKRSEVMRTKEMTSSLIHCFRIERIAERVCVPAVERTHDGRRPNSILVSLRPRRKTRMEVGAGFFHGCDPNL